MKKAHHLLLSFMPILMGFVKKKTAVAFAKFISCDDVGWVMDL